MKIFCCTVYKHATEENSYLLAGPNPLLSHQLVNKNSVVDGQTVPANLQNELKRVQSDIVPSSKNMNQVTDYLNKTGGKRKKQKNTLRNSKQSLAPMHSQR